jgi:hypothetical protein
MMMSLDYTQRFYLFLTLGFATSLVGLVNLLLVRWSVRTRLLTSLGIYATSLTTLGSIGSLSLAYYFAFGLSIIALVVFIETRWSPLSQMFASRKRAAFALIAVGLVGTAYSMELYTQEDEAHYTNLEEDLEKEISTVQLTPVSGVRLTTDAGELIEARSPIEDRPDEELLPISDRYLKRENLLTGVISHQPPTDSSNCHGWVFTGGRYWILGRYVETILSHNGYHEVERPRPGDIVVYRNDGAVTHTAIVRYVTDGLPVLVEGKWGQFGVFLHEVDRSCYHHGFKYYTTNRPNHLLRGLGSDVPTVDSDANPEDSDK